MSPLIKDLLINGLLAGTAMKSAKKTSIGVAYYAFAGVVASLGIVFLSIAGYGFLLENYTMPIAAAMTGSVILLVAIGIGLCTHYGLKRKKLVKKPAMDGNFINSIEGSIKSLLEGFEEPVKDNPKMALLMAVLAGFAAGDQFNDRVH